MRKAIVDLAKQELPPEQRLKEVWGGRAGGHNAGLLLQRWLTIQPPPERDASPAANQQKKDAVAERKTLLSAAVCACQSAAIQEIYQKAYDRWDDSFPKPSGDGLHPSAELRTQGRLIVGLGSENVLETGIRLHHTYGVPVIPGSALKGLAAHYCNEVWGQRHLGSGAPIENKRFRKGWEEEKHEYHKLLFGTTDDGGVIVFHDAWITPESLAKGALLPDVMTPHHPDWQNESSPKPPTDFDSPVPVSFLSVAGAFQVRVSWSGPTDKPELAKEWTTRAFELLRAALAHWGIGGKTSSGYGRLVVATAPPDSAVSETKRPEPAKSPKRQAGSKVKVKVLETHSMKDSFFVQELDQPKRGLLTGGKPHSPLPEIGADIDVYINSLGPPPQYRWDPLRMATPKPARSQRGRNRP